MKAAAPPGSDGTRRSWMPPQPATAARAAAATTRPAVRRRAIEVSRVVRVMVASELRTEAEREDVRAEPVEAVVELRHRLLRREALRPLHDAAAAALRLDAQVREVEHVAPGEWDPHARREVVAVHVGEERRHRLVGRRRLREAV